jgi:hypothetical protein
MAKDKDVFIDLGDGKRYLSAAKIADMLQITEKTLLAWHKRGEQMGRLKTGRTVIYEIHAYMRWLDEQEAIEKVKQTKIMDPSSTKSGIIVTWRN